MSAIANFKVKQERPTKLSDPHRDFGYQRLNEILATPDDQLNFSHYRNLLGPYLPAGTYTESVYFLPLAFRHLLVDDGYPMEYLSSIIGFCSHHLNEFEEEGTLETVRACLREILDHWTREFVVVHFDLQPSQAKEWGVSYGDNVKYSYLVVEATSDLVKFKTYTDIAEAFVHDLAYHNDDPIKAAWFLEYSRSQRNVYHPPLHKPITQLINNKDLLFKAALVVQKEVRPHEKSPTYWRDTFKKLGLE